jgi:fatty acid amide hydrolase 2
MAVAVEQRGVLADSAVGLARRIRSGELSSRAVVEEHLELVRRVNPRVNAIVCERFDQALAEADAADARVAAASPDEELPPLLGVPCTIKESIAVAGMPNCAGLVARREHRSETTAPTAQRLIDAGAIPIGVTNTSELTMWIESENRLYGRTHNAYDQTRIAGGSSGGEGAAVGSGFAPIGLGSDIGGSIRFPAFYNGVFGHKGSAALVPNTGQYPSTGGDAALLLSIGPLTRRAEDLMPVLRLIAGPDGVDPQTRAVELGDPASVELRGLSVVLAERTSYVPVRPEIRRARDRAAEALEAAGAKVRTVEMRSLRRALEIYLTALQHGADVAVGDIIRDAGVMLPTFRSGLRRGGEHTVALRLLLFSERFARRVPQRRVRRLVAAGRALAEQLEATIGDGVLLHPPAPRVAPRHGRTVGRPWTVTNMAIFNLAGLPATEVPLGLNPQGLPLGVQVVAGRDRDHVSIAVAQELERAFGGWVPPNP